MAAPLPPYPITPEYNNLNPEVTTNEPPREDAGIAKDMEYTELPRDGSPLPPLPVEPAAPAGYEKNSPQVNPGLNLGGPTSAKDITTSTSRNYVDPKERVNLLAAQTRQAAASKLYGEKEMAASDADTQLKQLQGEELSRIQDGFNTQILERRKELDGDIQAIKSTPIDSGRVWRNASTGDKVMAGIALLLSSAGQAMGNQGPNAGLQYIQKTIDQDIDAQKFDLLAKKDLIQEKRSMMAQLVADRGYTVEQAAEAMKIGRYGAASEQLKTAAERARKSGNEALAQKLVVAAENIATNSAEKMAELSTIRENKEVRDVKLAPKPKFFDGMPESQSGKIINSIADIKDAERFKDYIEKSKDDTKGFGLISKIYAQARSKFPDLDPADAKRMAMFQADIAKSAKAALGAGTVTDSDIRFGEKLAANYGYDAAANIAILQNRIDSKRSEVNDLISIYSADGRVPSQELLDFVNKSGPKSAGTPDLKPVK